MKNKFASYAPVLMLVLVAAAAVIMDGLLWLWVYSVIFPAASAGITGASFLAWLMSDDDLDYRFIFASVFVFSLIVSLLLMAVIPAELPPMLP